MKTHTFEGRLERMFFGGWTWVLHADDGQQYQLTEDLPEEADGDRVVVEGTVDDSAMGFSMVGPILKVARLRRLP